MNPYAVPRLPLARVRACERPASTERRRPFTRWRSFSALRDCPSTPYAVPSLCIARARARSRRRQASRPRARALSACHAARPCPRVPSTRRLSPCAPVRLSCRAPCPVPRPLRRRNGDYAVIPFHAHAPPQIAPQGQRFPCGDYRPFARPCRAPWRFRVNPNKTGVLAVFGHGDNMVIMGAFIRACKGV